MVFAVHCSDGNFSMSSQQTTQSGRQKSDATSCCVYWNAELLSTKTSFTIYGTRDGDLPISIFYSWLSVEGR